MKKCLIILAAAAMLAGCAEKEVITPEETAPAEITFTTAPLTKADAFGTDKIVQTYAFYTASTFDYTSGEEYIPASTVSHTDDVWKTEKTYLWPKDGGVLSFFSWSLNSSSLKYNDGTDPKVTFSATDGITLTDYSSVGNNDFMVADPALNLSGNANKTYYHIGVPTLFRHKASQIAFKVKTSKDYSGRTFKLAGITFANISTSGTYKQGTDPTNVTASTETWTPAASTTTTSYYSSTEGTTFADTEVTVPVNGTSIFVPQDFTETDGKTVTVTYTITSGTTVTEKSATISMNKLLGGGSTVSIQKGKYYTVTLIFSVGTEILWNPEVKDWTEESKDVTVG